MELATHCNAVQAFVPEAKKFLMVVCHDKPFHKTPTSKIDAEAVPQSLAFDFASERPLL